MANIGSQFMGLAGRAASLSLAGMLALTVSAQAGEKSEKGRYVNLAPETKCAKISDVDGHFICSYEHSSVFIPDDGEMGTRLVEGTGDFIKGIGKVQGYTVSTFADGSQRSVWYEGETKLDDKKKRFGDGTYTCVGGSGRFVGIKCEGKWKTTYEKGGFGLGEYEGKVTLPD